MIRIIFSTMSFSFFNTNNFTNSIFENKTHMVYDKIQPATKIIKYIDNIINL